MRVEEDVAGLDIAVDYAGAVGVIERGPDALKEGFDPCERQWTFFQTVGKGAAGHVAHDDVRLVFIFPRIIDRNNGGIFEPGNHFNFVLEARAKLWFEGELPWQNFDRYLAFDVRVMCQIDDCHAALPQFSYHLIPTDIHECLPI